jgi:hypothetical protein
LELIHDWQSFQGVFYPRRKHPSAQPGAFSAPVYFVVEKGKVVAVFAGAEDMSECIGEPVGDLLSKLSHRQLVIFEKKDIDDWMAGSAKLPHFYDQAQYLRAHARPHVTLKDFKVHSHFLLSSLYGWWRKLLPHNYGVYLKLEGATSPSQSSELMVIVRRGRVDGFYGLESGRDPQDAVRMLHERHMVPVQGFVVQAADWNRWSEQSFPWRQVSRAMRKQVARMVPFRWGVAALIALRGLFGL